MNAGAYAYRVSESNDVHPPGSRNIFVERCGERACIIGHQLDEMTVYSHACGQGNHHEIISSLLLGSPNLLSALCSDHSLLHLGEHASIVVTSMLTKILSCKNKGRAVNSPHLTFPFYSYLSLPFALSLVMNSRGEQCRIIKRELRRRVIAWGSRSKPAALSNGPANEVYQYNEISNGPHCGAALTHQRRTLQVVLLAFGVSSG